MEVLEFHEKLQELRKSRGMTQEELAAALFVSRTAISKWESGDNLPSIDSAVILAWIFDIPVEDLFVLNDSDEDLDEEDRKVTACK